MLDTEARGGVSISFDDDSELLQLMDPLIAGVRLVLEAGVAEHRRS